MDCTWPLGGKVKKHLRNEFNFEIITTKVQALSYFDQHVVTHQCSSNLIETINNFATGIWKKKKKKEGC